MLKLGRSSGLVVGVGSDQDDIAGALDAATVASANEYPMDEAYLLDAGQLEELRLLTNADMDSYSPFAALLVGQPTLRRRIKLGTFAALDQRIALRYTMAGMSEAETKTCLTHHLSLAGRSDTRSATTPPH